MKKVYVKPEMEYINFATEAITLENVGIQPFADGDGGVSGGMGEASKPDWD